MIELYIENPKTRKGRWFELPILWKVVQEKLALEDEQVYEINDYSAPIKLFNFEDFDYMNEVAEQFDEHEGHEAIKYLEELIDAGFFNDLLEAFEQIDEIYVYADCYSYTSYAEQLMDDLGYLSGVPDIIKWNIDYEGIGEDLRQDGRLYQASDNTIIEVMA
ncbi:antirestriction protein ArdA [Listeria innocua]|uniref:antirestriction protein ArdA n=1 Tax=Bacilli TaxID=91061 RepID=UPI000BE00E09|nr:MULTISPECIES: antirestriction protein ArdA [Bacilli]HCJ4429273.1 antirestriction protein ArdA [Listeria innocua]EKM3310936.1 antirestriction protein ArdA [Listeria monocytogenes]MCB8472644.1 antirestriction protein ArdA [Enterococcus faecalis]MCB8499038.1 antirestriction protein ArdA [Enterococcus faecalis]MCB8518866.1 antirestriction protein ArdA [Enterococcus faecalis]